MVRSSDEDYSLVIVDRFIQATRDSGYRGTGSALAELVDNALEAGATRIHIRIEPEPGGNGNGESALRVEVVDNGSGMDRQTLRQALRFGGSSRFNSRRSLGRYGMGLPNSSLSQARRVDVCSWTREKGPALASYLDVDEITGGTLTQVPQPVEVPVPEDVADLGFASGTIVSWRRCDRLDHRRASTIETKLAPFLGRVFRHFLWRGVSIDVNRKKVVPIDPLFLHERSLTRGGRAFAEPLQYDVSIALADGRTIRGPVVARFSELPVDKWHALSNDEKQRMGVLKRAGVSVVRAGREIDYGWFFMGDKRKENYDDWWRCEVSFGPELDEAFGITHTKQQIHPRAELNQVLAPDMEAVAKALNRRVRCAHERLRSATLTDRSERIAASKEELLPRLPKPKLSPAGKRLFDELAQSHPELLSKGDGASAPGGGTRYTLVEQASPNARFFRTHRRNGHIVVALNTDHPFYSRVYKPLRDREDAVAVDLRGQLELVLLSLARAEVSVGEDAVKRFADTWSKILSAFLQ